MVTCPAQYLHTPNPTFKYKEWRAKTEQTHTLHCCPGCGLYLVWVPKLVKVPVHG